MKTAEHKGKIKSKPSSTANRGEKVGDRASGHPPAAVAGTNRGSFQATAAKTDSGWRSVKVNIRTADFERIREYCRGRAQGISPFFRYAAILHLDIIEDEQK